MKQKKPVYQQKFDYLVTDYEWDGIRECLVEKPVKRDLFEEIQSNKDCALDVILDKFGGYPPVQDGRVPVQGIVDLDEVERGNDLLIMARFIDTAEMYREKYNLPLSMSVSEIYEAIENTFAEVKEIVDNSLTDKVEEKPTVKEEEKKNEKKENVEESK
ncbi:hypothetical protein [Gokushovirinae sp.]|nr:hypothetical protein [Gokushovirinae sp.]